MALKRLRAALEDVPPGAERQLPPERELAAEIGVERAPSAERQALYVAQHRAIIAAIAGRRPAEAEAAMRAHLEALEASLRDVEALADAG